MIERSILLQETSAGPRFVSNETACAQCPGACFSATKASAVPESKAISATIAISARSLNGIAMRLFAAPLVVLVVAVTCLDAVTNAYPLLQVLPLQLSILAIMGALMTCWTRVLRVRWSNIGDVLKVSAHVPTIREPTTRGSQRRIVLSEAGACGPA